MYEGFTCMKLKIDQWEVLWSRICSAGGNQRPGVKGLICSQLKQWLHQSGREQTHRQSRRAVSSSDAVPEGCWLRESGGNGREGRKHESWNEMDKFRSYRKYITQFKQHHDIDHFLTYILQEHISDDALALPPPPHTHTMLAYIRWLEPVQVSQSLSLSCLSASSQLISSLKTCQCVIGWDLSSYETLLPLKATHLCYPPLSFSLSLCFRQSLQCSITPRSLLSR